MHKNKKKNYIEEMKVFFNKTSSVFVTHYQGLTVKQIDELRAEMRKHGILFKITKNRITKLALGESKFKKLENLFSGPTAVAFSEDAIASAKILTKFSKINPNLKIIENYKSLIETLLKDKPKGIKGDFILSLFLTSTMGVSFKLKYKT